MTFDKNPNIEAIRPTRQVLDESHIKELTMRAGSRGNKLNGYNSQATPGKNQNWNKDSREREADVSQKAQTPLRPREVEAPIQSYALDPNESIEIPLLEPESSIDNDAPVRVTLGAVAIEAPNSSAVPPNARQIIQNAYNR